MSDATLGSWLRQAQDARQRGDLPAARRLYEAVLRFSPAHPFALNSLGNLALATGDAAAARDFFLRAVAADDTAPELWSNLAKAQRELGDDAAEHEALSRVLALDRLNFMANLRSAELAERLAKNDDAALYWNAVVSLASRLEPPPNGLERIVERGRTFLAQHAARFEAAIADPLAQARMGLPTDALRRFDMCVDAALGRRRIFTNECHGLHYPLLPADEFFENRHFPWFASIEAQAAEIRDELANLLADDRDVTVPYVDQDPGTPANKWSDLDKSNRWSAFFLWKHGVRIDAACARCPVTANAISKLPLSDIPGRSPTVFFSILAPRTRIPGHTGVTNTRAIVHLPLIVPSGCGFRVGGEVRTWTEGKAFAFDDTIEHEAWNDSDEPRAVLIFDAWNPHLDDDEKRLLRTFFTASDASGFSSPREG